MEESKQDQPATIGDTKPIQRELGVVTTIKILREKMTTTDAYYIETISKMINKSIPATRRYLRLLSNLGLLIVKRDGISNVYCLPEALQQKKEEKTNG